MEWTRSETLALAAHSCAQCDGLGLRYGEKEEAAEPCNCVLRSIFRACFGRFRECITREKHISKISLDYTFAGARRAIWSRKDEEYVADFCLVSRRSLSESENRIFKYHFLLGADWRLCCRKLKLDRGTFFHGVYRIQQKLGRTFRELEPYSLYPLSEYFHGDKKSVTATRTAPIQVVPIRPPVTARRYSVPDTKAA